jgi:rhodanese-related sulfurtransferase
MDEHQTPEIDVDELDRRRRSGEAIVILDVRESWEIDLCRIPESQAIPLATLPEHLGMLPRDRPLVLVCHHGVRSQRAAAWLRANGFENAVNLVGGVDAWARRIDPAMRIY